MPIECDLHHPNVVIVRESGVVTLAGCLERIREIAASPALGRPAVVLVDKRDVAGFTLNLNDVIEYAREVSLLFGSDGLARIAYVVNQPEVYGTARQAQVMLGERSIPVGVFRDFDEARAWVEADDSTVHS